MLGESTQLVLLLLACAAFAFVAVGLLAQPFGARHLIVLQRVQIHIQRDRGLQALV